MSLAEIKKNLKDRIRSAIPADSIVGPEMIGFNRGMRYAIEQIELEEQKIKEELDKKEKEFDSIKGTLLPKSFRLGGEISALRGLIGK